MGVCGRGMRKIMVWRILLEMGAENRRKSERAQEEKKEESWEFKKSILT